MPSFTQAELNTEVAAVVSGEFSAANFLTVANHAVRDVLTEIDLRSSIRSVALSPNLFDDIYHYTYPSDAKGNKVIDIKPQVKRGKLLWDLVTAEEFDRKKNESEVNLVAISRDDLVNKLLISRQIDDQETVIDILDSVGDWAGYGQGENITKDSDDYVKGSGCLNWDIGSGSGTTAGIYNDSLDTFDISDYLTNGQIFVWVYISSTTNLTNFIIRVGSASDEYYYITITTNNEGVAFYAGWNLLRFDFVNKTASGTVDVDACDYVALYMTKTTAKVSETDYRFDNLVMKLGKHYSVIYYSRYFWQSSAVVYLEDATTTTDLLNCETDEYNLIIRKTAQYMEEFLRNSAEATKHETIYERKKAKYIFENPSQALLLIQEYYNL